MVENSKILDGSYYGQQQILKRGKCLVYGGVAVVYSSRACSLRSYRKDCMYLVGTY